MTTYVLDASVAVAAVRKAEPGHRAALKRCMPLFRGQDEIIVPAIFDIEVTSALVRRGAAPRSVVRFLNQHFSSRRLITLGPRGASAVCKVVGLTRLRAADAIYVWLAGREGVPLVTLDREVIARAPLAGVTASLP
jgi:predicted nucleic acid-binding protein